MGGGTLTFKGGNVYIGTTKPQTALHIVGPFGAQLKLQNGANNYSWNLFSDQNQNLVFVSQDGPYGFVDHTTGNYVTGSDQRLKTDIEGLGPVLDRVLELRPVSYRLKPAPAPANRSLGFIAQEVEPLFPELIGAYLKNRAPGKSR